MSLKTYEVHQIKVEQYYRGCGKTKISGATCSSIIRHNLYEAILKIQLNWKGLTFILETEWEELNLKEVINEKE